MTSAVTDTASTAFAAVSAASPAKKEDGSERFLKLLVAQMRNQDPLNPMDNAQVTSQMAQISTVTGIEKLNDTVAGLSSQMLQSQTLAGAGLVGRSVLVEGNALRFDDQGTSGGFFELASPADSVKVEILSPAGRVIDTIDMGAASAGRSGFEWQAPAGASTDGLTFRVAARSGGTALAVTTLAADAVRAVSTSGNSLQLELLHGGPVPYTAIKAFS